MIYIYIYIELYIYIQYDIYIYIYRDSDIHYIIYIDIHYKGYQCFLYRSYLCMTLYPQPLNATEVKRQPASSPSSTWEYIATWCRKTTPEEKKLQLIFFVIQLGSFLFAIQAVQWMVSLLRDSPHYQAGQRAASLFISRNANTFHPSNFQQNSKEAQKWDVLPYNIINI